MARYDAIGRGYARQRRADPRIARQIAEALLGARTVVDVGAGTGSYEKAGDEGHLVVALEPSPVMIAQRPVDAAPVVRGVAGALPFADASFDAALAVFTIHHWDDVAAGLREIRRVARRAVVLTFDPVIHLSFWLLREYVPESLALASTRAPTPAEVAELLGADRIEVVPVPADCEDGFNWAYWRRPHAYLDPEVRRAISALALLPEELVTERMRRLESDLEDGTWLARHGELLELDSVDGGLRLVVRE